MDVAAEKTIRQKRKSAQEKIYRSRLTTRLYQLMGSMDIGELESLVEAAEKISGVNKRIYDRIPCLISADCLYEKTMFQQYVRDISQGGLFIETRDRMSVGTPITMTLSLAHYHKPFKVAGEIVRETPKGFGVKFQTTSSIQDELIKTFVSTVEKFKNGAARP